MPLAPAKFPRRYAQRQALRIRSTASSSDLRSQDEHQRHRPRITRKCSAGADKDSDSTGESDKDSDSTGESDKDSDSTREYLVRRASRKIKEVARARKEGE
jgi:hypothetical protein